MAMMAVVVLNRAELVRSTRVRGAAFAFGGAGRCSAHEDTQRIGGRTGALSTEEEEEDTRTLADCTEHNG